MNEIVVKMAQVESVIDDADGLRIRVSLEKNADKYNEKTKEWEKPYAFPLLPKTFQSVPKVGEGVLIFSSQLENNQSNLYYIGPILSQPQHYYKDSYIYGRGNALALLQGGNVEPLPRISLFDETKGAFPETNDVAVVGRKSEDIVLKDDEIDIRCGIRGDDLSNPNYADGFVVFNKIDPAYIQLKHKEALTTSKDQEGNSAVNIVADKVNLISHKDVNSFNLTDNEELIKSHGEGSLDDIMKSLHQVPYGDILVDALNKIRDAIDQHVHAYPGLPPCKDQFITALDAFDFEEIKSKHIRIS